MKYKTILGIMVCSVNNRLFYEKGFYKYLQILGKKMKILVYVFYPDNINWDKAIVNGYHFNFTKQKWENKQYPLPNFIYDRCFYVSAKTYLKYKPYVEKIKQNKRISLLGHGLKGKWEVYEILARNSLYARHLPKTEKYKNHIQLFTWLRSFPIVLKPIGGSHGAGVIKITKENNNYIVIGRNLYNQKITFKFQDKQKFINWVNQFIGRKRFIIQQYLDLFTSNEQPYDVRVLVQKDQNGAWDITGMSARLGDKDNITSNLHGGGRVEQLSSLLEKEFDHNKANIIINEINRLVLSIPSFLESNHGNLFELGIDIGIDRQGRVWVIEVNSKPGRKVFSLLNDKEKTIKALSRPILYTEYLKNTYNY